MERVIQIRPESFDCDWRSDLAALGVSVPENLPTRRYTPVNHNPMPFSVDVDINAMKAVMRTIGVIPNAAYRGHIYRWDEFCCLISVKEE